MLSKWDLNVKDINQHILALSTENLEGFDNKIKVAKRIGYGYRDDEFLSL